MCAMDLDDIAPPPKKKSYELGQDLSKLSVAELRELIEALKNEIARVEQTLKAKQSSLDAAQSVFKR
jgi:uncharacterized small protein (DUF1192 family)